VPNTPHSLGSWPPHNAFKCHSWYGICGGRKTKSSNNQPNNNSFYIIIHKWLVNVNSTDFQVSNSVVLRRTFIIVNCGGGGALEGAIWEMAQRMFMRNAPMLRDIASSRWEPCRHGCSQHSRATCNTCQHRSHAPWTGDHVNIHQPDSQCNKIVSNQCRCNWLPWCTKGRYKTQ